MRPTRVESDSFGELEVPTDKFWGAQTQRSLKNFAIGYEKQPYPLIRAMIAIKQAAAKVNIAEGKLDKKLGSAIIKACKKLRKKGFEDNFPLSVWQTGSGTQTNMNVNEVIANLAIEDLGGKVGSKDPIHPNDHVNMAEGKLDKK